VADSNHQHHQLVILDLTQNPVITDAVTPQACKLSLQPFAKAAGIFLARDTFVQIREDIPTGLRTKFPKSFKARSSNL